MECIDIEPDHFCLIFTDKIQIILPGSGGHRAMPVGLDT